MKKLVFAFAAIVAVSFASCGGNTAECEACDSDSVCECVCEEEVAVEEDTTAADSLVEEVVEEVAEEVAE